MPKVVDHEARRAELGRAVWRVLLRHGIQGATLREIAAEAGWSTGVLAHYFRDKDELLRFAFRLVIERVAQRVAGHGDVAAGNLALARAALLEALALDEERRAEAGIWFTFAARALTHPDMAEELRAAYRLWRDGIARLLSAAHQSGETHPDLDPQAAAAGLIALVDGLVVQALADPSALPAQRQVALLDQWLARLMSR